MSQVRILSPRPLILIVFFRGHLRTDAPPGSTPRFAPPQLARFDSRELLAAESERNSAPHLAEVDHGVEITLIKDAVVDTVDAMRGKSRNGRQPIVDRSTESLR
jgi:hypothetical protein